MTSSRLPLVAGNLLEVAIEAPMVLFEIATDGTVLTSVGAGRDALRRAASVGENVYDLYADVPSVQAALERAIAGEAFTQTSRVPGKEGEVVFETTYIPVRDGDGLVTSVRGVALDVTRRVQAQEAEAQASREALSLASELKALTDRLQTEREDERRRVARDVHDELGQALTALRFEAGWLRRQLTDDKRVDLDAARSRLDDVEGLLDQATASVQRISAGLRPPALDLAGITGAVQAEAFQFEARTGVQCTVVSTLSAGVEAALPEPAAVSLFRVIQEALTNVARHADAESVEIRLSVENGLVDAEVEDDGRGFDVTNTRENALGLVGARERIGIHSGRFLVSSRPGQGTTVRAAVSPIPPSRAPGRAA